MNSPTDLQLLLKDLRPRSCEAVAILKHTKLNRSTLFRIKRGDNKPSIKTALLLIDYFGEDKLTLGGCFDGTATEKKS